MYTKVGKKGSGMNWEIRLNIYTLLCIKQIIRIYCVAQGSLLNALRWPKWEGNPKKRHVWVTQWCLALCNPMDRSPWGSSDHEFSRQEFWSGLPFPSPGDFLDSGKETRSPTLQADSLLLAQTGKPERIFVNIQLIHFAIQQKLTQHCKATILQ